MGSLFQDLPPPASFSHFLAAVVRIQRNWLGECTGTTLDLPLVGVPADCGLTDSTLEVWTDRPELAHGVAFVGLAEGHLLDRPELVSEGACVAVEEQQ